MKKIIMTVGCPGSGKTTWANEYVRQNSGFVILSRDDFREKLYGLDYRSEYKYTKAKEKTVTNAIFGAASSLLETEAVKGIIVADTNLNPATVNEWELRFAGNYDIKLEFFHVPWTELLKRNKTRGHKSVPVEVLREFYRKMEVKKTYVPDYSLPRAVIFDLDGTLADNDHRSPYDLEKLGDDKPKEMVFELLRMLRDKGYFIITVSGRESGTKEEPEKYRFQTIQWLMKHGAGLSVTEHHQRKQGDTRKDDVVKEEIFWNEIATKYCVKLAVDDRDQVVEMWRRIGVECWQVGFGEF